MDIKLVFRSPTSGNTAVASLLFGPNQSLAIETAWADKPTDADMSELEEVLKQVVQFPDDPGSVVRMRGSSKEQSDNAIRKFFAQQNTN